MFLRGMLALSLFFSMPLAHAGRESHGFVSAKFACTSSESDYSVAFVMKNGVILGADLVLGEQTIRVKCDDPGPDAVTEQLQRTAVCAATSVLPNRLELIESRSWAWLNVWEPQPDGSESLIAVLPCE